MKSVLSRERPKGPGELQTLRILSALTPSEVLAFFGRSTWWTELDIPVVVEQVPLSTKGAWHEEIQRFQPDVVVGAWKTPPLPSVADDGTLPVPYYCHVAGSVRRIVSEQHIASGMLVSNWGSSVARYIAEMALTLALASLRNIAKHQSALHSQGGWRTPSPWPECSLFEKKVGLHGFGAIGRELVPLLAPFNVEVAVWDPFVSPEVLALHGVTSADSLEALFARSEVVVECCALTKETECIVNETLLAQMPLGAVFINVARGLLVDEGSLENAIANNRLRAGLDVFVEEPLPERSRLRSFENAILTPHVAGNTVESRLHAGKFALRNLCRYAQGLAVEGVIDLDRYQKMT